MEAQSVVPADAMADAPLATSGLFSVSGSLSGATTEPGEPAHGGRPAARSVWIRVQMPAGAYLAFIPTRMNGVRLAVYTGAALGSLVPVVAQEFTASDPFFGFPVDAGVVYHLAFDSADAAAQSFSIRSIPAATYLRVTPAGPVLSAPAILRCEVVETLPPRPIRRVRLMDRDRLVGERSSPPWVFDYTNAVGGSIVLQATVDFPRRRCCRP